MPYISVIIPVYNCSQYISRCLQSILKSSYSDFEIICIDDGSTDDSINILNNFVVLDSRIRIVHQDNQGVSAARNKGMSLASGKYIAFIDSDDWIHHQYLEILLNIAEKYQADIVVCKEKRVREVLPDEAVDIHCCEEREFTVIEAIRDPIIKSYVWGRLYLRDKLKEITFIENLKLGEDMIFNLSAMCLHNKIKIVGLQEKLYYYFQRDDSLVHSFEAEMIMRKVDALIICGESNKFIPEYQSIFFTEALKSLFAYRYLAMFDLKPLELRIKFKQKYDRLKKFGAYKKISIKEKLFYSILAECPFLYRVIRIVGDPTMIMWEKDQKKKIRFRSEKGHV